MIASMVIDLSIVDFLTILPSVFRYSKNISPDIYAKIALVQANAHQPRSTSKHRVRLKDLRDLDYRCTRARRRDEVTPSFLLYNCMLEDHLLEHPADPPVFLPKTIDRHICFVDPRVLN
jgi:hypothetical protein